MIQEDVSCLNLPSSKTVLLNNFGGEWLRYGNGDESKGCAFAMRDAGARVLVTEMDPIYALQACMVGFQVVKMEDVDIFTSATGNLDIRNVEHIKKMKDNAIIGYFENEIDMAGLGKMEGIKVKSILPQVD